ncbi:hypothetical protein BDV23DRAFT_142885 [Aspergillus alliaceus]|uniref:Uncharacterized protein n=1 Tax=Petromyces alliaceus TaxID=209559 RepID=A0A5N7CQM7_PETAA|nr:hypothetical protein BDV23DRAFT_142885 [Aspergillus alliaceus]
MQIPLVQKKGSDRPKTDYERWLRGQDENFRPGDRPLYGPGTEELRSSDERRKSCNRLLQDHEKQTTSHGYLVQSSSSRSSIASGGRASSLTNRRLCLDRHTTMYSVIVCVLLAVTLSMTTKVFRKRQH